MLSKKTIIQMTQLYHLDYFGMSFVSVTHVVIHLQFCIFQLKSEEKQHNIK